LTGVRQNILRHVIL